MFKKSTGGVFGDARLGKVSLECFQVTEPDRWRTSMDAISGMLSAYVMAVSAESSHPKGHFANPLSDREVEVKFRGLTECVLSAAQEDELLAGVWQFEDLDDRDPIFAAARVEEGKKGSRRSNNSGAVYGIRYRRIRYTV